MEEQLSPDHSGMLDLPPRYTEMPLMENTNENDTQDTQSYSDDVAPERG